MFFFPYTSDNMARDVCLIWLSSSNKFLFWKSRDDNQESGKGKELFVDQGQLPSKEIFHNFHAGIKN